MQFTAIGWNLFHGRDFPPDPALFTWRSRLLRVTERNATHAQVNRDLLDEFAADQDPEFRRKFYDEILPAMLERGTSYPVLMGWGEYLLAEAQARGFAVPLVTGGPAPEGYVIQPEPWGEIISDGVKQGNLTLDGSGTVPMSTAIMAAVAVPAA